MSFDPASLVGDWQILRAELGGQPMPADAAGQVTMRFAPSTYSVRFGTEVTDEGTYAIEPAASPVTIHLTGETGVNAGRTIPGILQLTGDRLRICYALESNTPPDEFKAAAGALNYLATYRRIT